MNDVVEFFRCQGCGRDESECTVDPCEDVISDRHDGATCEASDPSQCWGDCRTTTVEEAREYLATLGIESPRVWFRNSYGGITDGNGWEIYKDSADDEIREESNETAPWSLWRRGEYVGNYATPADAKADAHPVEND